MFYSQEILIKKGSFGVIWLAATLGNRSQFRKLSRKEVYSVDIRKSCNYIVTPPEPLALRLASNLMFGVTRVYKHQCDLHYIDANNVVLKLQRDLSEMKRDALDMTLLDARMDNITINEDPKVVAEIEMAVKSSMMKHTETIGAADFGWVVNLSNHERSFNNLSSTDLSPISDKATSAGRRFLLDNANPFDLGNISLYTGGSVGSFGGPGMAHEFDEEMSGAFGDEGERTYMDIDDDGNIFIPPAKVSMEMDEDDLLSKVRDDHAAVLEKRKAMREHLELEEEFLKTPQQEESFTSFDQENRAIVDQTLSTAVIGQPSDMYNDYVIQTTPSMKGMSPAKQRRKKSALIDGKIELTDQELQQATNDMLAERESYKQIAKDKERSKRVREYIAEMLMPPKILHPSLKEMYRNIELQYKFKAQQNEAGTEEEVENEVTHQHTEDGENIFQPTEDLPMFDSPSIEADRNFIVEPERARNIEENSQPSISRDRFIWNQFDWSNAGIGVGSVGGKSVAGMSATADGASSIGKDTRFSTPIYQKLKSNLPGSFSPLTRGHPSLEPGDLGVTDFDLFGEEETEEPMPFKEADIRLAGMERETENLLNYLKYLTRDANVNSIRFSELFPPGPATNKSVAADAFFRILVLSTRKIVKPEQEEAYGDIELSFFQ